MTTSTQKQTKSDADSRNDDTLQKKWSGPRIVRDETNRWPDPGLDCSGDPGQTDQSQKDDCDVNVIVDRFMKTGVMPNMEGNPIYGDFASVPDYQNALDLVARAQEQFDGLDAKTRKRFDNDPLAFLDFVNDPKNTKEMIDLGLATERKTEAPKAPQEPPKTTDNATQK